MLPSPCTLQPVFVDRLHCHLCNVMFRHVVSKRVDSSESLLPTSRDKVYEQVGVYSSYYILLVLSPKGDSKGPDRCSAKNNKTLVRKEPKGRMQSTITRIVCSALMPNVTALMPNATCTTMLTRSDHRALVTRQMVKKSFCRKETEVSRYQGIIFLTCRNARLG